MNLLIADDNATNLKLLRAQLEAEGMTVFAVSDGVQALAVLHHEPVDVVISDILMPNMDGYQLCHTMRKNTRFGTIPCILYSNTFASESNRDLGLEFGADLFLNKPAPVEVILAAVGDVIAKGCQHREKGAKRVQYGQDNQLDSGRSIRELERENAGKEETKRRLLKVNHKLLMQTKSLEKLEVELRQSNEELEQRVRERTAELQAANEELESFSYSVSHDLRAPLRHVRGYVELLVKDMDAKAQLSAKARQYLNVITGAGVKMGQLIDDLLEFSRMGRQEMHERSVCLNPVIQSCLQELEMVTCDRNIVWKIAPLPTVAGDPSLLKLVFANLLGNAVKYTRPRDPAVIEVGCVGEDDGRVILFVRDNGVGFDMQYAHKLFGVFQRLHRAEEFEGTGIGLANVRRIIDRHGGRAWAEAEVNQGATVYLTLKHPKATLASSERKLTTNIGIKTMSAG